MRILVTGASGHIGSAVVPELLGAGHQVVGLARSDASAAAITALGAEVRRGDLDDPDGLRDAAAAADGVIHLASKSISDGEFAEIMAANRRAVEALCEGLDGSGKPLVITTGTLPLSFGDDGKRLYTELDVATAGPLAEAENAVIATAERGVRTVVVRPAPLVHSTLDHHGFAPTLIAIARAKGVSGYFGDGANRWPAVHTLDAARLYRLAVEQAPAGFRLHAVADEGVPFREIAESVSRHLNVPLKSIDPQDTAEHFGFMSSFVALDNPTSSARTQDLLGWQPVHPGLLHDLDQGHYFATAAAA
jgi:nucleoside-diphosphate-sugar epimerase